MSEGARVGTRRAMSLPWLWWRFSARRIIHHPLRILIVVISISLATTLWDAVTHVSLASVRSFEQSLQLDEEGFQVFISPVGGRFSAFEISQCLASLSPYTDVLVVRREPGVVEAGAKVQSVSVMGVGLFTSRHPEEEALTREMYVAPSIVDALGAKEGTSLTLRLGEQVIHGRARDGGDLPKSFTTAQVVVPLGAITGDSLVDVIAIRRSGTSAEDLARTIAPWIRSCFAIARGVRVETADAPIARGAQLLAAYRFNILIMAIITLIVCGLLISQATHLATRAVVKELAIVRTLGVSCRSCFAMLLLEASLVSVAGVLLGYTVGSPGIVWLTGFLLNTASDIYHLQLGAMGRAGPWLQGVGVAMGMVGVGAVSAAFGAREVLRLPPYRGTRREQVHTAPLRARAAWGITLGSSVISCVLLLFLRHCESAALAYLSIAAVVTWAAAVPMLLLLYAPRVTPLVNRAVACWLARGAIASSGRHFILSAIAASIAVTLMTGLSIMICSFRGTLTSWSDVRLAGDLFVSAAIGGDGNEGRIEGRYLSLIEGIPSVERVLPYYETSSQIGIYPVVVGGVDLRKQCQRRVYPFLQGGCGASREERYTIVSEGAARKLSLKLGDSVSLEGRSFVISGVFQEFGTEQPLIVIDSAQFLRLYPEHNAKTITIDLTDRSRLEIVRKAIESLAPESLIVRDHGELLSLVQTLFNRTFRVTESVRWIVFGMAMFGLISTTLQYLWERRREFKTAAVLGVSRSVLAASIAIEAGTVTLAALSAGIVAGIVVGWCLTEYINPLVFGWSLEFSVGIAPCIEALAFFGLITVCTGLIALPMLKRINDGVRLADE